MAAPKYRVDLLVECRWGKMLIVHLPRVLIVVPPVLLVCVCA